MRLALRLSFGTLTVAMAAHAVWLLMSGEFADAGKAAFLAFIVLGCWWFSAAVAGVGSPAQAAAAGPTLLTRVLGTFLVLLVAPACGAGAWNAWQAGAAWQALGAVGFGAVSIWFGARLFARGFTADDFD